MNLKDIGRKLGDMMKEEKIVNKHLDIPFKDFMPGQIIQSSQFNDDMLDIEDKVNEIVDKHNLNVNKLHEHLDDKENPHEVNPHQIGTYEDSEIDAFINDVKNGNLNDEAITNRVLADACVDNRVLLDGAVTLSKLDTNIGNQIDISNNMSIKERYTKLETDAIIQEKVGDGTYSKEQIDAKFEEYQAGTIVDGTIGVSKLKDSVGRQLDITHNPSIFNRYTKSEVNTLIAKNGLPKDWGNLSDEVDDEIVTQSGLGSLPISDVMVCGEFKATETDVLNIKVQDVEFAKGEFNTLEERLDNVDLQLAHKTNILNDNSTDTNNISIEHGKVNYFSFVTNSSKIKGVTLNNKQLKIYDKYNNTYRNVPKGAIKENVVYNVKYNNEFYEVFIENIYDRVIIECGRDKEITELSDAINFARNFKCSAFDIVNRVTIVIQSGINPQTKKVYISTEDSRYIEIVGENALTGEMTSYYPISNLTWSNLQTTDDNRGILNIWKSSFGEIRGIEFKLSKVMTKYLDCFLYLMNASDIHFEQCVIDLTECSGNEVNGIVAMERSSFRSTGLEKEGMLDRCIIKMPVNGGNRAVVVNGLSVGNINNIEIINKCNKGVLVDTSSDVLALKLKATLVDIPIHVNYGKVTTNNYTIKDGAKFIIENHGEVIDLSTDKKGLNLSNYRKNTDGTIELFNTTKVNTACTTSWAGLYTGGVEITLPTLFKEIKSVSVNVYTDDGVTALSTVSKVTLTSIGVSIFRPASTPSRTWNISYRVIGY